MDKKKLDKTLAGIFNADFSQRERGEVYAKFVRAYLKAINEINREYEVILDGAIDILKDLNSREKELAANLTK